MLLGKTSTQPEIYVYGAITLYGPTFQWASTSTLVSYCATGRQTDQDAPHNPTYATPAGYHTYMV